MDNITEAARSFTTLLENFQEFMYATQQRLHLLERELRGIRELKRQVYGPDPREKEQPIPPCAEKGWDIKVRPTAMCLWCERGMHKGGKFWCRKGQQEVPMTYCCPYFHKQDKQVKSS